MPQALPITMSAAAGDAGKRLDQFLAAHLDGLSRARVQELIAEQKVLVDEKLAKASFKLRGGERIRVLAASERPPLRAMAEEIPLDIVFEDDDLAIINKPAGMMVHAGAGASDEERNRGTLVNALLHHFSALSGVGGVLRPGIVHRLDKETSGLIVVAKNDQAHRRLAEGFSRREVKKTYRALVHGWVKKDRGTITESISRDRIRRTRMTTRLAGGREAITHYTVVRRLETAFGPFTLLEIKIDTGRTHQIRVHMASLGHPVVGDTLYGAPRELGEVSTKTRQPAQRQAHKNNHAPVKLSLSRNFLHAAALEFEHPQSGKKIALERDLPQELQDFLAKLED